ncbi:Uma2 family endonuclease [Streptomyces sp. SCA3-4]|uniref:Uma2 family endonuclease n=1 Tax=Streptomyces sichuanensis TaxID=2871810 RepID=UPI001CE2534C|nr:Uma2 family endonuclease [Streptomyces sichuanensis]MCA6093525.1 Uma2 family endonuclease [Streptomyces sichuanensis]
MTPRTVHRPQMLVEEFEQLARAAPETVRLEFVNGKIEVKPVPDGTHGAIFMWLLKVCMQQRPELSLFPEQGLKVEAYRKGRARPDGALAPDEHFVGQGEWADSDGVLMAVEITSYDADTNRRDRREKRDGYAAAEIPLYLLIDRDECMLVLYSDPDRGTYRHCTSWPFGDVVEIPAPVGITLHTEKLKDYAD